MNPVFANSIQTLTSNLFFLGGFHAFKYMIKSDTVQAMPISVTQHMKFYGIMTLKIMKMDQLDPLFHFTKLHDAAWILSNSLVSPIGGK